MPKFTCFFSASTRLRKFSLSVSEKVFLHFFLLQAYNKIFLLRLFLPNVMKRSHPLALATDSC